MSFATIQSSTAGIVIDTLGVTSTYTGNGYTPTNTAPTVFIETDVEYVEGAVSDAVERRTMIYVKAADVAAPRYGDTILASGTTYTVEAAEPFANGTIWRLMVED